MECLDFVWTLHRHRTKTRLWQRPFAFREFGCLERTQEREESLAGRKKSKKNQVMRKNDGMMDGWMKEHNVLLAFENNGGNDVSTETERGCRSESLRGNGRAWRSKFEFLKMLMELLMLNMNWFNEENKNQRNGILIKINDYGRSGPRCEICGLTRSRPCVYFDVLAFRKSATQWVTLASGWVS